MEPLSSVPSSQAMQAAAPGPLSVSVFRLCFHLDQALSFLCSVPGENSCRAQKQRDGLVLLKCSGGWGFSFAKPSDLPSCTEDFFLALSFVNEI